MTVSALRTDMSPAPAPSLEGIRALTLADMESVNQLILRLSESHVEIIPALSRHLITSGGKRLRPMLTLAAAALCGYKGQRHIHLAASVEFLHTATLLHDDVVDGSALRRGLATANHLWGNKTSVLVGDYILSQAFKIMVADGCLDVLHIFADAAAVIAEGEVMQLASTRNLATTLEMYLNVITAKTAKLFAAACELGAALEANAEHRIALRDFGHSLGIAFQVIDDLLDYSAEQEKLGKSVGDDFREGKITAPVIFAYEVAGNEERTFLKRTLEEGVQENTDLSRAQAILRATGALDKTRAFAEHYAQIAETALRRFPESAARNALMETLRFSLARAY